MRFLLLLFAALALAATPAIAQNPSASANFGQVSLGAGFYPDPHTVSLQAGGAVEVDVPGCGFGHVSSAPDYKLNYSSSGALPLTFGATSGDDTTLLVNLPDGSWVCNDDGGEGRNPLLTIPNAPSGRYDIWVGTFSFGGSAPATLFISESGSSSGAVSTPSTPPATSGALNPSASANFGQVSLGAGFYPDPHTVSLQAGGAVEVDVPGCGFGHVSSAPDYKLNYSSSGALPLTFGATSGDDTTLLVNLPDGSWVCNDDGGEGRNPLLTIPNAPSGRYDIWVGTFSFGGSAPATLFISESGSSSGAVSTPSTPPATSGALNPSASANFGQVSLGAGFYPDPHTVSLQAGGAVEVDVPGCGFGHVSSAPDYKLNYSSSGALPLTFGATSGDDTTLLVNLPDGSWVCNDDGGEGRNPLLTIPNAPSGRYDIWVGTFSFGGSAPATLFISESGSSSGAVSTPSTPPATSGALNPSASANFGQVSLGAGFYPDPHTVSLQAGGAVEVDVPGCGFGHVSSAPDYKLNYSSSGALPLTFGATSGDDTTLLVNLPDGSWVCNDDGGEGRNPLLTIPNAPSGRYDIWVGTFSFGGSAPATLFISESGSSSGAVSTPSTPPATSGALNPSASANFGQVSLGAGFYPDPHTVSLQAGGAVEVDVPGCGFGHVSSAPDYKLNYSSSGALPLTFGATSGDDTTLLVNLPDGSWVCNDDGGEGRNPLLTIPNAPSGRYDIWVGTFSFGGSAPATLFISERTP